jgi:nickel-type superoxide dismutase maturation protease
VTVTDPPPAGAAGGIPAGQSRRPRWPVGRVAVSGGSMLPEYAPGDWLFVRWGADVARRARPGDVLVLARPDRPDLLLVKRLIARRPDGGLWVQGDNSAASDDSRQFGAVPPDAVLGRVLFRYHRAVRSSR